MTRLESINLSYLEIKKREEKVKINKDNSHDRWGYLPALEHGDDVRRKEISKDLSLSKQTQSYLTCKGQGR